MTHPETRPDTRGSTRPDSSGAPGLCRPIALAVVGTARVDA